MARPKKKYHYIYKTTCNLNGKYYIGMHSTSNLEDGYMGSGKRLRYSIRKYGIENHTKEIIEFLEDRESLEKREAEIVNEELIDDPLCINLICGGTGGFSSEQQRLNAIASNEKQKILRQNPNWVLHKSNAMSISRKKGYETGRIKKSYFYDWTGKKHKEESKKLIGEKNSIKQKGSGNSQFGTCWITNEIENRKIKKGDLIPEGWRLGRKLK